MIFHAIPKLKICLLRFVHYEIFQQCQKDREHIRNIYVDTGIIKTKKANITDTAAMQPIPISHILLFILQVITMLIMLFVIARHILMYAFVCVLYTYVHVYTCMYMGVYIYTHVCVSMNHIYHFVEFLNIFYKWYYKFICPSVAYLFCSIVGFNDHSTLINIAQVYSFNCIHLIAQLCNYLCI